MNETPDSLLAADEPPAFTVDNENGTSPFLIVADHAGKQMPQRLGQLGLSNAECDRHIAWDIGVGAVCCLIGKALDAVVIRQNYSRLVIDCNRTPWTETSILGVSESTRVPGNIGLSERHKLARVREIFQPYHDRIAFKKVQRAEEGEKAKAEYEAEARAIREKTLRLRSLRLAKEAAELATEVKKKPVPPRDKPSPRSRLPTPKS